MILTAITNSLNSSIIKQLMRENMTERMIKQFIEMVKIDSKSGNEKKKIDYLLKEFVTIGAGAEKDSYGNLIAKLPAKGYVSKGPILLSCLADTVKPGVGIEPLLQNEVISLLPIWRRH